MMQPRLYFGFFVNLILQEPAEQEPLPEPVCSHSPDCKDCPYPRHGFLCWGADGTCLRTRMNKINGSEENKNDDSSGSQ